MDQDIKIAQIASILEDSFSPNEIKRALFKCNGSISKCIDFLLGHDDKKPYMYIDNALPADLAELLLDEMLVEAQTWTPFRVSIFGKELLSHHTTCLYGSDDSEYYYQGRASDKRSFSDSMTRAMKLIGNIVGEMYLARQKSKYEPAKWIPNFAVSNYYRNGDEYLGAHSDSLTLIGPMPLIASLTLGAGRTFRIHPKSGKSVDVLLKHNSVLIMWPSFQELFKHSLPRVGKKVVGSGTLIPHIRSNEGRINLTFRMNRKEYSEKTPICKCGLLSELRPTKTQKYFYSCGRTKCGFFKWLEELEQFRSS
jgi:alkylated DNA repair dioxygenase AlkB